MTLPFRLSRTLATTGGLVIAALAIAGCQHQDPTSGEAGTGPATQDRAAEIHLSADQLASVRTAPVVKEPFVRTVDATGTVAFDQDRSAPVLAPLSGPVRRVLVEVGDRVVRGQPLAIVTSPDFAAAVSDLRKAESVARNARRIADLDEQLFKNDAIARRDMEQAETDAVSAEADRDAAVEQLRSLGVDTKTIDGLRQGKSVANPGAVIRSPLAGTLVEKFISPGQLLEAGATPCFTVADLSRVWVLANLFEADLPFVAVGDPAEVTAGSGAPPITGTVDNIAAFVDPNTRAIAVRLVVPNPDGILKRDQYVRVRIRSRRETTGLLVPVAAVLRDDEDLPYVYLAEKNGDFARRRVQVGVRTGDRFEITQGLSAGDSVVVEGGLFLHNTVAP